MVEIGIYLDKEENEIVIRCADKWNLNKQETIKRMIAKYLKH